MCVFELSVSLFIFCNGVCRSVFLSMKLKSTRLNTRGFNVTFIYRIPSVSVVKFTVEIFKFKGLAKNRRKCIYRRTQNYVLKNSNVNE